jgi:hypothetical protein
VLARPFACTCVTWPRAPRQPSVSRDDYSFVPFLKAAKNSMASLPLSALPRYHAASKPVSAVALVHFEGTLTWRELEERQPACTPVSLPRCEAGRLRERGFAQLRRCLLDQLFDLETGCHTRHGLIEACKGRGRIYWAIQGEVQAHDRMTPTASRQAASRPARSMVSPASVFSTTIVAMVSIPMKRSQSSR